MIGASLRKTVYTLKEEKIDFSDNNKVQDVASNIITDIMIKRYPSAKNEIVSSAKQFAANRKAKGASNANKSTTFKSLSKSKDSGLTTAQKRVLEVIEQARVTSGSAISFMDKLAAINTRVDDFVPENERQIIHQIIATTYYKIKELNNLVGAGLLPGITEKRPTPQNGIAINNLRLSDLITNAHADPEPYILNTVYIFVGSGGNGSTQADWYRAQIAYHNAQVALTEQQIAQNDRNILYLEAQQAENDSWWNSWGQCAAGTVGGAVFGALEYGGTGALVCIWGTPAASGVCATAGAIWGFVGGALGGAAISCQQ